MAHILPGSGMCMTTDYMLIYSRLIRTRSGGTGVGRGAFPDLTGDMDGDGIRRGITIAGILLIGMADTGAAIGAVTGDRDGTTIITIILITGGEEDGTHTGIPISVRTVTEDMNHHVVIIMFLQETVHQCALELEHPAYEEIHHLLSEG